MKLDSLEAKKAFALITEATNYIPVMLDVSRDERFANREVYCVRKENGAEIFSGSGYALLCFAIGLQFGVSAKRAARETELAKG